MKAEKTESLSWERIEENHSPCIEWHIYNAGRYIPSQDLKVLVDNFYCEN